MKTNRYPQCFQSFLVLCLMLCLGTAPALAKAPEFSNEQLTQITSFLGLMQNYIQMIQDYSAVADSNEQSAAFAVMEIKNVYEESGNPEGAIQELEKALSTTNNKTIKNVIRFQLQELYKKNGQPEKSLATLRSILQENG